MTTSEILFSSRRTEGFDFLYLSVTAQLTLSVWAGYVQLIAMFVYFLYKGTTYVGVGWGLPRANIAFSSIFEIFAGHDKWSLLIFTDDAEVDNITLLTCLATPLISTRGVRGGEVQATPLISTRGVRGGEVQASI